MTAPFQDVKAEITPRLARLYEDLLRHTGQGLTPMAPAAAAAFVNAHPRISNDLWMSRVIALAAQSPALDSTVLSQMDHMGPLAKVQAYDYYARRLDTATRGELKASILAAGLDAKLGLEELSLISIRTLLLETNALDACQVAFARQRYPSSVRESLQAGDGIWLGARGTVKALGHALESIHHHSLPHLDKLGLVLLAPDGQVNADVLAIAKRFKKAVMLQYRSETELVERLRALKMRIFIELHGLQNPASFLDTLRFGVAPVQLSWAGQPESCPVPFMDGQLLDPILAQARHASCRPIPLRCWLPPALTSPLLLRGSSLGIWAMNAKISDAFLVRCTELAQQAGKKLQIFGASQPVKVEAGHDCVEFIRVLEDFRPAVLLDTFPISGGNSCLFALRSGLPVVTLPGASISSRLGASILCNYGFPEGVATSLENYNELVLEFCKPTVKPNTSKTIPWEFVDTLDCFFGG